MLKTHNRYLLSIKRKMRKMSFQLNCVTFLRSFICFVFARKFFCRIHGIRKYKSGFCCQGVNCRSKYVKPLYSNLLLPRNMTTKHNELHDIVKLYKYKFDTNKTLFPYYTIDVKTSHWRQGKKTARGEYITKEKNLVVRSQQETFFLSSVCSTHWGFE